MLAECQHCHRTQMAASSTHAGWVPGQGTRKVQPRGRLAISATRSLRRPGVVMKWGILYAAPLIAIAVLNDFFSGRINNALLVGAILVAVVAGTRFTYTRQTAHLVLNARSRQWPRFPHGEALQPFSTRVGGLDSHRPHGKLLACTVNTFRSQCHSSSHVAAQRRAYRSTQ